MASPVFADTTQVLKWLEQSANLERTDQSKAWNLAQQALSESQQLKYETGIASAHIRIGSILYTNGFNDSSRRVIHQALALYKKNNNADGASGAYLLLSYIYQSLGMQDSAFATLYSALKWNNKQRNPVREAQIHVALGELYLEDQNPKLALENFTQAATISAENNDLDGIISSWSGLGQYHLKMKSYAEALQYFLRVDTACLKTEDVYSLAQNHNNIALCYELLKDFANARKMYERSLQEFTTLQMTAEMALGHYNLGNLFLELKKTDEAIPHLLQAASLGRQSGELQRIAKSYQLLANAYAAQGDYSKAYQYQKYFAALRDSVLNEEKIKQISNMQAKYEDQKKEQKIALLNAQNNARKVQQIFLLVGASLLFLLAVAVFIGWMKTRKQKQISEELLLNILPAEVAKELKEKGEAEAKYLDEVSVLFTDFKDFTKMCELLTPKELVSLLHDCFKSFDEIITRYGLEKVKTIGDSYMCAGGLPQPMENSAEKVVLAGLEIQRFMESFSKDYEAKGGMAIEMRVGVHTGPVVAGIVGTKKFAYDVWGDTVNIASRMESKSDPGKVNISATTYERVKDKFHCTFRGMIDVKNKGMVEMYFVDGVI